MKKILLLLIMSIAILAGCAISDEPVEDDALVVWAFGNEAEQLEAISYQFTVATGIPVSLVPIPWDIAHDKIVTAIASKDGPDVIQLPIEWVSEMSEAGALADMSSYVDVYPETFSTETYFPQSASYMYDVNEELVAVPYHAEPLVLYVRTDILEAANLEIPQTWDELYTTCQTLVNGGYSDNCVNFDNYDENVLLSYLYSYGWEFVDEDGTLNFDDELVTQLLEYGNKLYQEGLATMDAREALSEDFTSGRTPFIIAEPWFYWRVSTDSPELDDTWEVVKMPAGTITNGSYYGGSYWTTFEWSDKKDESAAFINWVTSSEVQMYMFKESGLLPPTISTWEDATLATDSDMLIMKEQLLMSTPPPKHPEFENIMNNFLSGANSYWQGEKDIATVQKEVDEYANAQLE